MTKVKKKEAKPKMSLRIPVKVQAEIWKDAAKEDRSFSYIAIRILEEYYENKKQQNKPLI